MSWQDRTDSERRDLRERRQGRRDRKAGNTAAVWHGKQAAARSPIDQAAFEFDRVRRDIKRIRNPIEQDAEWARLAEVLQAFGGDTRRCSQFTSSRRPAPFAAFHAQTRARARDEV